MTHDSSLEDRIDVLAASDRRYAADAYHFVFRALDWVLERRQDQGLGSTDGHVPAIQLLDGLRDYALELFGPLARLVLERWGVRCTEDFGEIVFGLVDCQLLNKQDSDRKSDFSGGFSFREAFDLQARVRADGETAAT